MFDIWSFLLQTLNVSTVAIVLLIVKRIFKDKISPKWQFALWSILAVSVFVPAQSTGKYSVFNWRFVVEFFKILLNDFSETRTVFPFPLIKSLPQNLLQLVFFIYALGVIFFLLFYTCSYIRLKVILKKEEFSKNEKVFEIAEKIGVKPCKVIESEKIKTAFICGILHPVLVLPKDEREDEMVIMHEIIHLKNKDTFWSFLICICKSIHWINPLSYYIAKCALNDMEYRCDQIVLEKLEGDKRREYGYVLLKNVNEKFAKIPGATCINNGGKMIKERIETIARFKMYPEKMGLVCFSILLLLASYLCVETKNANIYEFNYSNALARYATCASAKSTYCTTYEGAIDSYAKAVISQNMYYRLMCADESEQKELLQKMKSENNVTYQTKSKNRYKVSLTDEVYHVLTIEKRKDNEYTLHLAFPFENDDYYDSQNEIYNYDFQKISVKKENGRWVVYPLGDFETQTVENTIRNYEVYDLGNITYFGKVDNLGITIKMSALYKFENRSKNESFELNSSKVPVANAKFSNGYMGYKSFLTCNEDEEERNKITDIFYKFVPVYESESENEENELSDEFLKAYDDAEEFSSISNTNKVYGKVSLEKGWGPHNSLSGGGYSFDAMDEVIYPKYYVAYISVNHGEVKKVILKQQEVS